jgi:hypothetical protein
MVRLGTLIYATYSNSPMLGLDELGGNEILADTLITKLQTDGSPWYSL